MPQNPWSAEDEDIRVTYSPVLPYQHSSPQDAAGPPDGEPEPGPLQAARGAWPRPYYRLLNAGSLGAVFALGMVLGAVLSGHVAPLQAASRPSQLSVPTGEQRTSAQQQSCFRVGHDSCYMLVTGPRAPASRRPSAPCRLMPSPAPARAASVPACHDVLAAADRLPHRSAYSARAGSTFPPACACQSQRSILPDG
jgi:hypothetical protein